MRLSRSPSPGKVGGHSHKHPTQDFCRETLAGHTSGGSLGTMFVQV